MPGSVSDSYEGPNDDKPEIPDWAFQFPEALKELIPLVQRRCPKCGGSMIYNRLCGYHCFAECDR
jgi:hypothetical protein